MVWLSARFVPLFLPFCLLCSAPQQAGEAVSLAAHGASFSAAAARATSSAGPSWVRSGAFAPSLSPFCFLHGAPSQMSSRGRPRAAKGPGAIRRQWNLDPEEPQPLLAALCRSSLKGNAFESDSGSASDSCALTSHMRLRASRGRFADPPPCGIAVLPSTPAGRPASPNFQSPPAVWRIRLEAEGQAAVSPLSASSARAAARPSTTLFFRHAHGASPTLPVAPCREARRRTLTRICVCEATSTPAQGIKGGEDEASCGAPEEAHHEKREEASARDASQASRGRAEQGQGECSGAKSEELAQLRRTGEEISGSGGVQEKERLHMMSPRHLAERGDEVLQVLRKRHEPEALVNAAQNLIANLLPAHRRLQKEAWQKATERRQRAAAAFAASQKAANEQGSETREEKSMLTVLHRKAVETRAAAAIRVQELRSCEEKIRDIVKRLPNALDSRVPSGVDARDSKEVDRWWPPSLSVPPPPAPSGSGFSASPSRSSSPRSRHGEGGATRSGQKDGGGGDGRSVRGSFTTCHTSAEDDTCAQAGTASVPQSSEPSSASSPRPADHWALLAALNASTDGEATTRMAGRRHSALQGLVARLHRALKNFFVDSLLSLDLGRGRGFVEVGVPPLIVSRSTLEGTGQLPRLEDGLFALPAEPKSQIATEDAFLIPTAEVPLVGFYRQKRIPEEDLPIRLVAATPCFRREDGTYGRWNRGLLRQQVFEKVEAVVICTPEQAEAEHARLREIGKMLLKQLEIPFREVLLCSGDMGAAAALCYDLEAWLPSLQGFLEVSSISNCWDYQARRLSVKYQPARQSSRRKQADNAEAEPGSDGEQAKASGKLPARFCYTLNGSALAVGRTLVALIESHQFTREVNGKRVHGVRIPAPLRPYLLGISEILEEPTAGVS
ncbi:serine--tRNA ligase [Besnoitia besnoiti]|uniref:serine--tRNA ligase n=1 Tax=Besnoitia besnoiti TaxID=94643 RepID=A0A2A9MNN5_BESBE|nr:serine--tRNA ligase [Besnoitia besnoiti]PFH37312.1 serine--tRNA ligase [Besnoitia besnoiti]